MKHTLLKWMIGRSIDEGRPMPGWARRAVDGDPTLRDHEAAMRRMTGRLTAEADRYAAMERTDPAVETAAARRSVRAHDEESASRRFALNWSLAAAALALLILGVIWLWPSAESANRPVIVDQTPQRQVNPSPGPDARPAPRRDALSSLLALGRDRMERFGDRVREGASTATASLMRDAVANWVVEPVDRAATFTGWSLAMLDEGVEREGQALAQDARAAWEFYQDRLAPRDKQ